VYRGDAYFSSLSLFELCLEVGLFQKGSNLMDLGFNAAGESHIVHAINILVTGAGCLSVRCSGQYHQEGVLGSTEKLKVLFKIPVFVQHAHDQNTFLFW